MPIETVANVVTAVGDCRLLDPPQQDELVRKLQRQFPEPKALLRAMVEKGWLTAYHAKQIYQGRAQELVLGQYVLLELLGEGGMGKVFKARHKALNRIVALKLIRKEKLDNPTAVRRFQREMKSASKLNHPNIVLAFDADQIGETHFIAMEFVDGIDLLKLIKQNGPLSVSQACDYARQAALGLQHASDQGLVHRDIKPSNLLVTKNVDLKKLGLSPQTYRWGLLKILDMGLARVAEAQDGEFSGTLTHAGAVVGTPDYISPEQARDSSIVDIRSDLYSLGCSLYQLLTNNVPFPGGTSMEKIFKHQLEQPVPIEKVRAGLPPGLIAFINKLLARRPTDRPQTGHEVARTLEAFIQPGRSAVVPVPPSSPSIDVDAMPTESAAAASTPHVMPRGKQVSGLRPLPAAALQASPGLRKRRRFLLPLAMAALLLFASAIGTAFYLTKSSTGKQTEPDQVAKGSTGPATTTLETKKTTPETKKATHREPPPIAGKSALDALDGTQIPAIERGPDLPAETIAVLGEQRMRHWGQAQCAAYSPDGKLLATGGSDRVIRIWNPATGEARGVLVGHAAPVAAVAFWPDGHTLTSMTWDGVVNIWDVTTGKLRRTAAIPKPDLRIMALSPDGQTIALPGKDGTLKLWDLNRDQERASIAGVSGAFMISFSPDSKLIAAHSRGANPTGSLKIHDAASGAEKTTLATGNEVISAVAFSYDDHLIAAVVGGRILKLWDLPTGKEKVSKDLNGTAGVLAFGPDNKTLAVSSSDHRIHIGDLTTGQARTLPARRGFALTSLLFSPDGRTLVTTSFDSTVGMWDVATGQEVRPSLSQTFWNAPLFSTDGRTLVINAAGMAGSGGISVWDIPTGRGRTLGIDKAPGTMALALLPDQQTILTRSQNGLALWDLATGTERKATGALGGGPWVTVGVSRDLQTAVSFNQSGKSWDMATLQQRATLAGVVDAAFGVNVVAMTSDGKTVALGDSKGRVRLWDTTSGKELPIHLPPYKMGAIVTALSADGKYVAAGFLDGAVKMWDTATCTERVTIPEGQRGMGNQLAFSPDGELLVTWNAQGLKVFETNSGKERAGFKGLSPQVSSVAFSPDGKLLAASDRDGHLLVWTLAGSGEPRRIRLAGAINAFSFAPDSRHIATANANGTIYLLRIAKGS